MECRKCGAELHPDQKVCIRCGTTTVAGGEFHVEEDKQWKPTPAMIYGAAGAVVLIILVMILNSLRTVPPEVVAEEWFQAMVQRQVRKAEGFVTPKLQNDLVSQNSSLLAVADELYTRVNQEQAKPVVGKPHFDNSSNPKNAEVAIALKAPEGATSEVRVGMVRVGRQWRINELDSPGM